LDGFAVRTEIRVPTSLRDWLKITNGVCAGPGGLFGIRPHREDFDIESLYSAYPVWRDKKWIPIGGDGCGNYYVLVTQQELGPGFPVVFIDTSVGAEQPTYLAASDLEHFLVFLLEKELGHKGWPFNETIVVQYDPHILDFENVPLPWEA
jgi:hypothetical protein